MTQPNSKPQFNVKDFGAVGDGVTYDTAAIMNAYAAAAQAMNSPGGAGCVYFPPSSDFYRVKTLRTPSMGYGQGWLVSLFDNGLLVDSVIPGNNNAFIGRTSNFRALGNVFLYGPTAEWQQPAHTDPGPLLDISGANQVYFEGMAFAASQPIAVHVHDDNGNGSTSLIFKRCSIIGDVLFDSSTPTTVCGFTAMFDACSMGNLSFQNFGDVTIRDSYLHKIMMKNAGIPSNGNLSVDNCLTEALTNENFLTVDTSGGPVTDITLRRVGMADSVGTSYMLKHVNPVPGEPNWVVCVKFEMIPEGNMGAGLIDPSSAANLLSVICEGAGCQYVLEQAKSTLFDFVGKAPKGPLQVYGSRYLNPALVVEQGT